MKQRMRNEFFFEVVAIAWPEPLGEYGATRDPRVLRLTLDGVSDALGKGYTLKALPCQGSPYRPGEVLLPWNR